MIPIFRAGNYGPKGDWPVEKLNRVASNYNTAAHEAPLCIGHPEDNSPAFGWVDSLKVQGNILYAKMKDVSDGFRQTWKARRFNKLSASFYHDLGGRGPYLRHIGAVPIPEVKGLPQASFEETRGLRVVTFQEDEPEYTTHEIDFADFAEFEKANNPKGEDRMHEDDKKEVQGMIDRAVKPLGEKLDTAMSSFSEKLEGLVSDFTEKITGLKPGADNKDDGNPEADAAASDFTEQLTGLFEQLSAPIQAQFSELDRGKVSDFMDRLEKARKLPPAVKETAIGIALGLPNDKAVEFSEGGEKKTATPRQRFMGMLEKLPEIMNFDEVAHPDAGSEDFAERRAVASFNENSDIHKLYGVTKEMVIKHADQLDLD